MLMLAMSAFAFTSCEDVPEPYDIPGSGEGGSETVITPAGTGTQTDPYNVAAAIQLLEGMDADVETSTDIYVKGKVVSVKEYSTSYGNATFYISDDGSSTNQLYIYRIYGLGNKKFTESSTEIKEGDEVVVAGRFYNFSGNTPETVQGKSWLYSHNGKTAEGDTPDTPDTPIEGTNLLSNGDFETWTNGLPDNWKSASTASSATLTQSTVAHAGNYSVQVAGATSNKRLGYKEMNLKAGDYSISFYAKAVNENAIVRAGYAVVVDGKIGSGDDYKYGDKITISSEWQQVVHNFTLEADGTYCIVVMNSKDAGTDVLIDDFALTTTNGGVGEGGTTKPDDSSDKPSTGDAYLNADFANDLGGFTIENKNIPSELSYIWKHDSQYKQAKASAFANNTKYDTESWLISPLIDITPATTATLTFDHAGKFFGDMSAEAVLMAKTENGTWEQLTINDWFTGNDWTFVTATVDLSKYAGNKMQIAFVYKSTSDAAGTWEIKNVLIK